jgi:hypothetical protein
VLLGHRHIARVPALADVDQHGLQDLQADVLHREQRERFSEDRLGAVARDR